MKALYIIDPTARQYGYQIGEGIKVKLGADSHTITGKVEDIEKLHEAIENGETITIYDARNLSVFNGSKIVGAKIVQE
jgi:hypothetical protein